MSLAALKSTTALNTEINRKLVGVLTNDNPAQENVVAAALMKAASNDNGGDGAEAAARWERVRQGQEALSFADLAAILQELHDKGFEINPVKMQGGQATPLAHQAFYDALRDAGEDGEKIKQQLQQIRDEAKAQKGFVSKAFNIFASEKPLDKVAGNVVEFELYCQKNGITFDDVRRQLTPGEKPKTKWEKIKDNKFLIAAVGGTLAGLAGFNPEDYRVMGQVPGLFFTALPYFAVPYIGLSTFKAFSQRKIVSEIGNFGRFGLLMAGGIAIGFGAVSLLSGTFGTLEAKEVVEQAQNIDMRTAGELLRDAGRNLWQSATSISLDSLNKGFEDFTKLMKKASPGQILLPVLGASFALSTLYKLAKHKGLEAGNSLVNSFSKASVATGDFIGKVNDRLEKGFMRFVNYVGTPAIGLLLAGTMAQGGFSEIPQYLGYYGAVLTAMAGCAVAMAGAAYAYGMRKEEFREMAGLYKKAFLLSSSSATMPYTKQTMKKLGIREEISSSVAPLGATFDMVGTAQYLGLTGLCAAIMFGQDVSALQGLGIMGTALVTAFGAPGIPASSIAFMSPVLQSIGFTDAQMAAVFAMIAVPDRPFDMLQTGHNVTGDVVVGLDAEASARGKGLGGLTQRGWEKFAKPVLGKVPVLRSLFREKAAPVPAPAPEPESPAGEQAPVEDMPEKANEPEAPRPPEL